MYLAQATAQTMRVLQCAQTRIVVMNAYLIAKKGVRHTVKRFAKTLALGLSLQTQTDLLVQLAI